MSTIQNPELVFAVVPRVAAACSLMGSSWIVLEVLRDAQKRKRVYHRIMLGMSSFDIIASMCYFLGRWPLPPDVPLLPGGVGNKHTCTAQAFFGQSVVATVSYNTVLAVQYLMIIKLNIPEAYIEKKYERIMHGIPILVWLITGIIGIACGVFNPAFFNCWIMPDPINCAAYGEIPNGRPACIKGYYAPIFQWAIFYALIWFMIIAVTLIMLVVYFEVRKTDLAGIQNRQTDDESKTSKDTSKQNKDRANQMKRSREVAHEGLWYLFPFYATWLFPVITEITEMATGKYYDPMVVLVSFFAPFQGALNFIIYYIRPRYIKYREQNSSGSGVSSLLSYTRSRRPVKQENDIFCSHEVMAISVANHHKNKALLNRLSSQESINDGMESGTVNTQKGSLKREYQQEEEKVQEVGEQHEKWRPAHRVSFTDEYWEDNPSRKSGKKEKYIPYKDVKVWKNISQTDSL